MNLDSNPSLLDSVQGFFVFFFFQGSFYLSEFYSQNICCLLIRL